MALPGREHHLQLATEALVPGTCEGFPPLGVLNGSSGMDDRRPLYKPLAQIGRFGPELKSEKRPPE